RAGPGAHRHLEDYFIGDAGAPAPRQGAERDQPAGQRAGRHRPHRSTSQRRRVRRRPGSERRMTIERIEAARTRIRDLIFESPLVFTETLSGLTGNSVYLKLENLQMTGSYKERGALNRLL